MRNALLGVFVGIGIGAYWGLLADYIGDKVGRWKRSGPRGYRDACGHECRMPR